MRETPRTDELKRGIWRLMQSQEREEAYAWRDAIHCGIEQLERDLAAERERADRNQEDAERYRYLRIHPSVASETLPSSYQRFWCLVELDTAIDAARRK